MTRNLIAWYVVKGTMDRFCLCDSCKGDRQDLHLLRYIHETEPADVLCSQCSSWGVRILAKDWIPLIGIRRDS